MAPVPYATSFEGVDNNPEPGWFGLVKDWECPCPTATITWNSAAAKRTGSAGVEIRVEVPAPEAWHVQLSSPSFNFTPGYQYTACWWVRAAAPVPGGGHTDMNLLDSTTYGLYAQTPVLWSTGWNPICIWSYRPAAAHEAYFVLDLGRTPGTFFIDDFTINRTADSSTADADYVKPAAVQARINKIRKGKFTLSLVDGATGQPVKSGVKNLSLNLVRHDFPFGTALEWYGVPEDRREWYLGQVKRLFNALVPEWSFKWPTYEPSPGNTGTWHDYLMSNHIKFAQDNDFVLARGHTLEWLTASWGFPDHWSRQGGCEAYRSALETRIKRDVAAFRGKFQQYDVFNEIIHERQFVENCPGMWPSVLYDGFRWAHQADPDAVLCLNDYNLVTADNFPIYIEYVRDMLREGVPVHCLGVQAYIATESRPTPQAMKRRLDALASLGLPIMITESNFYTNWQDGAPVFSGTEAEHAALYNEYIPFFFSLPYIKGMLLWNFWDSTNWIRNGGLFYANGTAKASANAVYDLWHKRWSTKVTKKSPKMPKGVLTATGYYGKYTWSVSYKGRTYGGVVEFPASRGAAQRATITLA